MGIWGKFQGLLKWQGLNTHLINQRRLKLCSLIHCTFLGSLKESGKTHFRCYVSVMEI